jgi:DNA invertase Pin-like site-specific DNA recombinase
MARKSRKNINAVPVIGMGVADQNMVLKQAEEFPEDNRLATAAYIRLSVENNGHETDDSIQTQIALVESYIQENEELVLKETYIDNGFSGTKFDRPEFVRMMEDVKTGRIQCIVVKDLSRFGRDYLETGYYIETIFPLLNVRFIAITDQFDSTREEDRNSLSIPIKNMVNAMYAKDYSRKQETFREMCKKTGRVMGINAPYGYRMNRETNRLEIDEEVAPYVRMVFAWALAGVKNLEISKRMELIGAPTPAKYDNWNYGEHWSSDTVKTILINPAYAGFHVMGKSKVSLYKGISGHRTERKDWIYFPDFHEPYITMNDYEQIENRIAKNKRDMEEQLAVRTDAREKMPDVFRGMVFCADCGRQMNFTRGSHHRGYMDLTFLYYRCRYSKKYENCRNKKIQQNFLKIVVMDQIRVLIQTACDKKKLISAMQQELTKPGTMNHVQRNVARLGQRIQEVEERIIKAYESFAEKLLDEEEYLMIKEKLNKDKQVLMEKQKAMSDKLKEMERALKQYQEQAQHLEKYLEVTDFDERLVKELVGRIWVWDDSKISLEFKCENVFDNALVDEFLTENGRKEA